MTEESSQSALEHDQTVSGCDTIEAAEVREPLVEAKDFNVKRFIKRHITVKLYQDANRTKPAAINLQYDPGELCALCRRATAVFKQQKTLVEVPAPCTIIGDIHGQFTDLLRIFYAVGWPHQQRMLFLGDYIDRGPNNLECVCLCLAYKLLYPKQVFLLRGNHEWRPVNSAYGFLDELNRRFNKVFAGRLFNLFNGTFDWMPLAAVVGGRILAMHGGIGPSLKSWDDIRNPIDELCRLLDVDLIVRAHQLVQDGYEFYGDKFVTVFSAPKYCNEFDNTAGILHVGADLSVSFTLLKPLLIGRGGGGGVPGTAPSSAAGGATKTQANTISQAAKKAHAEHAESTAVATSPIPPCFKPATKRGLQRSDKDYE